MSPEHSAPVLAAAVGRCEPGHGDVKAVSRNASQAAWSAPYGLRLMLMLAACALSACGVGDSSDPGMQVFKDGRYAEAAKIWKKAAREDDPVAQFNLGRLYESGTGVKQNYEAAGVYYSGAAKKNHPYAQGSLAVLYAYGRGLPQDFVQSYAWSTIAAANYPKWAREERSAAIRNRDIVAARMSAQELIAAHRAIEELQGILNQ